jgi:hypothetical protein
MSDVNRQRRTSNAAEREVMSLMLTTNAELVASVLREASSEDDDSVVGAIAATRSLGLIVDDLLHALVQRARTEGHTWAEIGALLHCSRQAAFQRFGGASLEEADDDSTRPIPRAAEKALAVIDLVKSEQWEPLMAELADDLRERASEEMFRAQRSRAQQHFGGYVKMGTPVVVDARHGYTVVDVPMILEHGNLTGHVTFNSGGQVAALAFETDHMRNEGVVHRPEQSGAHLPEAESAR